MFFLRTQLTNYFNPNDDRNVAIIHIRVLFPMTKCMAMDLHVSRFFLRISLLIDA